MTQLCDRRFGSTTNAMAARLPRVGLRARNAPRLCHANVAAILPLYGRARKGSVRRLMGRRQWRIIGRQSDIDCCRNGMNDNCLICIEISCLVIDKNLCG